MKNEREIKILQTDPLDTLEQEAREQIARFYAIMAVNKGRIPDDFGIAIIEAFHAVVNALTLIEEETLKKMKEALN